MNTVLNISNKIQLSGYFTNTLVEGVSATELIEDKRVITYRDYTQSTPIVATTIAPGATYSIDLTAQENAFGTINYTNLNIIYLETDGDLRFEWDEIDDVVYSVLYKENPAGWTVAETEITLTNLTASTINISGRLVGD